MGVTTIPLNGGGCTRYWRTFSCREYTRRLIQIDSASISAVALAGEDKLTWGFCNQVSATATGHRLGQYLIQTIANDSAGNSVI